MRQEKKKSKKGPEFKALNAVENMWNCWRLCREVLSRKFDMTRNGHYSNTDDTGWCLFKSSCPGSGQDRVHFFAVARRGHSQDTEATL